MQAASNAGTLERLVLGVTRAGLHQTRHLVLSELDLTTTEGRQRDVGDLEGVCGLGRHVDVRRGEEVWRREEEDLEEKRSEWKD